MVGTTPKARSKTQELREALQEELHDLEKHLTAYLSKLSVQLSSFVERTVVAESREQQGPHSEEGYRLGHRMFELGQSLMLWSRKEGVTAYYEGRPKPKGA